MIQVSLQKIIDNIVEFEKNKDDIVEASQYLSDDELVEIIEEVSEENDLSYDQTIELINELFGIGSTIKNVGTKIKTVGVKATAPFKVAGSYVKGLADRVKAKSQEMDDAAAQKLYKSREKLNLAKSSVTRATKKSYDAGAGLNRPKPTVSKPTTNANKPKLSGASMIRAASSGVRSNATR